MCSRAFGIPIDQARVSGLIHACVRALPPLLCLPLPETIDQLEQQQRAIVEPSEQAFVAKVRGVEQERATAANHIREQVEEAAAREREIERMQASGSARESRLIAAMSASRMFSFIVPLLKGAPCFIVGVRGGKGQAFRRSCSFKFGACRPSKEGKTCVVASLCRLRRDPGQSPRFYRVSTFSFSRTGGGTHPPQIDTSGRIEHYSTAVR